MHLIENEAVALELAAQAVETYNEIEGLSLNALDLGGSSAFRFPVHTVKHQRLERSRHLVSMYRKASIALFFASRINGNVIFPPVVVKRNNSLLLLDGAHRVHTALTLGIDVSRVWELRLAGRSIPTPFRTFNISQLTVDDSESSWTDRFCGLELKDFIFVGRALDSAGSLVTMGDSTSD